MPLCMISARLIAKLVCMAQGVWAAKQLLQGCNCDAKKGSVLNLPEQRSLRLSSHGVIELNGDATGY